MKKIISLLLLFLMLGCNNQQPVPESKPTPQKQNNIDDDHEHKPGKKGGYIIGIGRDNYHAEVVMENDTLKLYMLDKDENDMNVEPQTLTAYARLKVGPGEQQQLELKPATTNSFTGKVHQALAGKSSIVVIPSLTINKERFRVEFEIYTGLDAPSDEEKTLYLKPGGKYTEADIVANGKMTASQKFRGFKPKHDLKPKVGDKICPITLTKANPVCTWIVGGKTYEFCCPPCVEEFVKLAKEQPNDIKEPEFYIKQENVK